MKRYLIILTLLLLPAVLSAQDTEEEPLPRHQFNIVVGGPVFGIAQDIYYPFDHASDSPLERLYGTERYFQSRTGWGLSYSYRFKQNWRAGADFHWNRMEATLTPGPACVGQSRRFAIQQVFSFLPYTKYIYWDDPVCQFYFKAAVGGTLSTGEYERTRFRPAYELMPLGLQIGKRSVFLAFELGISNVYIVSAGIGYHF